MKLSMDVVLQYLDMCKNEKKLNAKTIKAYRIDLRQFVEYSDGWKVGFARETVKRYVSYMNGIYQPRTVKRKVASLRALNTWLVDEGLLLQSPFQNLRIKVQEPVRLPKTIPLRVVERMLEAAHARLAAETPGVPGTLCDAAVMELLFATGIRVSELCGLNTRDLDLTDGTLHICGKGARERVIQLTNPEVLAVLRRYARACRPERNGAFFRNRQGGRLSGQSVRRMLRRFVKTAGVSMRVTPHMFRHTLATLLLEEDVDIRYIQQLLGHASILTTQIYTHVAGAKQRDILTHRHPRNKFSLWGTGHADPFVG